MDPLTTPAPAPIFTSDNTAGVAPEVLEAVIAASSGHALPYGGDPYTIRARARFAEIFEREVDVLPVATGSAANALALAALTPPWGSVLCHRDSHINTDECGAPEFFTGGAKLVPLPGEGGRIDTEQLRAAASRKVGDVHSVQPSVLSITQITETGARYTLEQIRALTRIAENAGLRVHMDGARFANAVAASGCTPAELTWRAGVDVLSFGATKNGTMTADAIVVFDRSLTPELSFRTKRAGQLTSKMRFHSAQLDAYLTDDLWLRNAAHANAMAARLARGLAELPGADLLHAVEANILFCRLRQPIIDGLVAEGFGFHHDRWEPGVCRFVTSFVCTERDVDTLLDAVRRLGSPAVTQA